MPELHEQISSYAEILDQTAPDIDAIAERTARFEQPRRPALSRKRIGLVVAGAAASVVVAVGAVVMLTRGGQEPVATSEAVTTTGAATTTTTQPIVIEFTRRGEYIILPEGDEGWDIPRTGPGAVVVANGVFHMFRNGYAESRPNQIGYETSTDGVLWTSPHENPSFGEPAFPFGEEAFVRSGVVAPDGTWLLFFDVRLAPADPEDRDEKPRWLIGRATAPGPTGPWTFDPDPALEPTEGAWDEFSVQSPSVVLTPLGFDLFYVGSGDRPSAIGRARSNDGVAWAKQPGPILEATADWEDGSLSFVDVTVVDDRQVMLYAGRTASRRGLAFERLGTFVRYEANPVFDTRKVPRSMIGGIELTATDSGLQIWVSNGTRRLRSGISLLEYAGPLP